MHFLVNVRLQGPVHQRVELFLPLNALYKNYSSMYCKRRLVAVLLLLSTQKLMTCYSISPHDLYQFLLVILFYWLCGYGYVILLVILVYWLCYFIFFDKHNTTKKNERI